MDPMITKLPRELMEDILGRFPVKSVISFQLVSKNWRSVIKSRSFIDYFFSRSSSSLFVFTNGQFLENDLNLLFASSFSPSKYVVAMADLELVKIPPAEIHVAGDIILAPKALPCNAKPFLIFCYNVESDKFRRVLIQGIADTIEFRNRCRYGARFGYISVFLSPEHGKSIDYF